MIAGDDIARTMVGMMAPEICNDEPSALLASYAETAAGPMLEIGSGSGLGSTLALVRGLARNPQAHDLHCLEVRADRADDVRRLYRGLGRVHVYTACSVGIDDYPEPHDVERWIADHPESPLADYGAPRVLSWLAEERELVRASGVAQHGIAAIKQAHGIDAFALVLIDGSEFLGTAELAQVYGARVIALDDTRCYKCGPAFDRLNVDPAYELAHDLPRARQGFAVFVRRDGLRT